MLVIFIIIYFLPHKLHNVHTFRLTVGSLEGEGVNFSYMFDIKGLVKLGRLSGEDLDLSSWCIILYEKLAVSGIVSLVADVATYAKRAMRPKFGYEIYLLICFLDYLALT